MDGFPTAEHVAEFRRDGHTVVRGLGDGLDFDALRHALDPFAARAKERLGHLRERSTYDKAFLQMFNLWLRDDQFREFTLHERFAGVAATLLDTPAVRLYHDQALVKEAAGGHTPWHQDQRYWPLDGARTVTMWMALTDCTADMGTMRFASGSQRLGDLGPLPISDESEAQLAALMEREGLRASTPVHMAAGDASFHDGWVIHGAGHNETDRPRMAMTVIYVQDGAVITPPDSPERAHDLATWLPGQQPGDTIGSPINPRLGPTPAVS
jgi:ectoine hydroxylase-related dioxygenase (phytanoyl-CoA dioxygenase family)